jgi:Na+-driven multidrug efflux pump
MYREMMKKIWIIGIPSALQQAITSFSNVFVQSYINRFGSACMAGWASYGKIDQFAMLPMQSLSMATTTFVGQNYGAGDIKRAKMGTNRATVMSLIITAVSVLPLMIFATPLVALFNADPEVIKFGRIFMLLGSPFYVPCVFNQIYASSLRGAGDTKGPMIIMLLSFVVFRQIYLYLTSRYIGTVIPVALGYPVGWVLCSAIMYIYYKRGKWESKKLIELKL